MKIPQEPFRKYNLDEENKKVDSFTIRLNEEERQQFDKDKKTIQQIKDSTAMKQLAYIGAKVIHSQNIADILEVIIGNKRKNKRSNIADFEQT